MSTTTSGTPGIFQSALALHTDVEPCREDALSWMGAIAEFVASEDAPTTPEAHALTEFVDCCLQRVGLGQEWAGTPAAWTALFEKVDDAYQVFSALARCAESR